MIPRRLIQTARTANLPLACRAAVANVRLLNPDFEYCFFDNAAVAAFVRAEFPEYKNNIESFPYPIQRYDFFRYLAVYRLGGFYLDTDVLLAEGFESLTAAGCVFPFEELSICDYLRTQLGIDWELGNYAFGAEPGHPFLKAVIENCLRAQREPVWAQEMLRGIPKPFRESFHILNTTGPGLLTRTLAEHRELQADVTILFPGDVCDPEAQHKFGNYGVHLMQATWRKRENWLRTRCARVWESRKRQRLLKTSQALGSTRPGAWISK